jgi:2-iminobutanoate/2-iminopropanoate deaminase
MADDTDAPPVKTGLVGVNAYVVAGAGHRLVVTGQIGIRPDGIMEKGLRAQLERAFANLLSTCEAAGFRKEHLIKISTMVTEPGRLMLFREVRDKALGTHRCPGVYCQVAGLSAPTLLCEIEAEAFKSD